MMTDCINQTNQPAPGYRAEALPDIPLEVHIYSPREVIVNGKPTGKFHYTRLHHPSGKIEPVGYCAKGCSGHDSRLEAREHYRQYLLDHGLWLSLHRNNLLPSSPEQPWGVCAVCGRPAAGRASITHYNSDGFEGFDSPSGWAWCLCYEHEAREVVDRLFHFSEFQVINWTHRINMAALDEASAEVSPSE